MKWFAKKGKTGKETGPIRASRVGRDKTREEPGTCGVCRQWRCCPSRGSWDQVGCSLWASKSTCGQCKNRAPNGLCVLTVWSSDGNNINGKGPTEPDEAACRYFSPTPYRPSWRERVARMGKSRKLVGEPDCPVRRPGGQECGLIACVNDLCPHTPHRGCDWNSGDLGACLVCASPDYASSSSIRFDGGWVHLSCLADWFVSHPLADPATLLAALATLVAHGLMADPYGKESPNG